MSRKKHHAATRPFLAVPAPGREPAPMPVPHTAPRTAAPISQPCMPPRTQLPGVPTLIRHATTYTPHMEAMHLTM